MVEGVYYERNLDLPIFSKCVWQFSRFKLISSTYLAQFSNFLLNYQIHDFWRDSSFSGLCFWLLEDKMAAVFTFLIGRWSLRGQTCHIGLSPCPSFSWPIFVSSCWSSRLCRLGLASVFALVVLIRQSSKIVWILTLEFSSEFVCYLSSFVT